MLNSMRLGIQVRKLPCRHVFHDECVVAWLTYQNGVPHCPMCKSSLFASISSQEDGAAASQLGVEAPVSLS